MHVTRFWWSSLVLLVACEPPPVPAGSAGEPSITLLYPPSDAGTLPLDVLGRLQFTVVVDFEGLTFVPPGTKDEEVEGEGHYHVTVNGEYAAPADVFHEFSSEPGDFQVGDGLELRVSLQSNTHRDLDTFADWEDVAEYTVGEASAL